MWMKSIMDLNTLTKKYGIAITGGIACGKSTIADMVRKQDYLVIDADQVARLVVAPGSIGIQRISDNFGTHMVQSDGSLDRQALRELIISDHGKKKELEAITHPLIYQETFSTLKKEGFLENPRIWFYEAALIFEVGRQDQFLEVWVAYCDEELQTKRIIKRDHVSKKSAANIIAAQLPVMEKASKANASFDSNGSIEDLEIQVDEQLKRLKMEAPS